MSTDQQMDSMEAILSESGSNQRSIGGQSAAVSSSQQLIRDIENNKDREIAIQAQTEYENQNNELVLQLLETLGTNKAIQHNRLITQFGIDQNVDSLLAGLITSEDMDLDQHVIIDYNRALVLAKYKQRFDEAIDLLEQRRNLFSD